MQGMPAVQGNLQLCSCDAFGGDVLGARQAGVGGEGNGAGGDLREVQHTRVPGLCYTPCTLCN